jgi:3-oxoacyl-[acyl-carrier protein] reductase
VIGPVDDPNRAAEEFERQFNVNVRGASAAVRAAARVMKEGGRIITTGSIAGASIGFAGMGDYSATKAAVAGLTRVWARELGPRGITVNVIQPGPIETDMTTGDPNFLPSLIPMIPVGRYGQPDDIAALVTFLAGPTAGFINGAAIDIDGGLRA